jgi:hypothetical protein
LNDSELDPTVKCQEKEKSRRHPGTGRRYLQIQGIRDPVLPQDRSYKKERPNEDVKKSFFGMSAVKMAGARKEKGQPSREAKLAKLVLRYLKPLFLQSLRIAGRVLGKSVDALQALVPEDQRTTAAGTDQATAAFTPPDQRSPASPPVDPPQQ